MSGNGNASEHRTHVGNARRLVATHGADLRFANGTWYVWDGKRFSADKTGEAQRRSQRTARAILDEAQQCEDESDRKALAKWAIDSESGHALREMVRIAEFQTEIALTPEQFDRDPWLLNVANGTLDLRSGKLRAHSRDDLLTKVAGTMYDPDAAAPRWQAFLEQVVGDELRAFLQRAIGYALTGSTREQCLFLLHGIGANGKSTFLEIIRETLGDYARQAEFSSFLARHQEGPRNDIARLAGARFVSSVEAAEGRRFDEALVKQLSGSDTVSARRLYEEAFEFVPTFKVFLAANHRPAIRGTDYAIWRRIRLIPFDTVIPEGDRDSELVAKLRAELPGVLRWAIEGCRVWLRDGLGTPAAVRDATDGYRAEQDVFRAFLDECCIVEPGATEAANLLLQAYNSYVAPSERMSSRRFGGLLTDRGFGSVRSGANGSVRRIGLRLPSVVARAAVATTSSDSTEATEGTDGHSGNSSKRARVREVPETDSVPSVASVPSVSGNGTTPPESADQEWSLEESRAIQAEARLARGQVK